MSLPPVNVVRYPGLLGRAKITYTGPSGEVILETELVNAVINISDGEYRDDPEDPYRRKIAIELEGEVPRSAWPLEIKNLDPLTGGLQ